MGRRFFKEVDKTPIVFCHGLLGWGKEQLAGHDYFVYANKLAKEQNDLPPFLFPSTGPISSLHDQACELFFQIKGGLTDYGEDHSNKFNHKRYSRFYGAEKDFDSTISTKYEGEPLYSKWNKENPLDFVGHSMGGPLLTTLQQMLEDDFFYKNCNFPEHTSADWIRSISTISGVHNGSQLTWILGADEKTGKLSNNAKVISFLCKIIKKVGNYQNKTKSDKTFFDFHLDQWDLDNNNLNSTIIKKFADRNNDFFEDEDWAMYDLTPNSIENHNKKIKEYPNTWYFSYQAKSTFSFLGLFELFIPFICHFMFWLNTILIGNYKAENENWKFITKEWKTNDGMCPLESQKYPFLGRTEISKKDNPIKPNCLEQIEKGKWIIIKNISLMDHAEQAMMPHFIMDRRNRKFYKNLLSVISYIRR